MAKLWSKLESYEIDTDVYSGPLDLLLDLIQKAELDITKLALASVTDQFLAYVEKNKEDDPERISEFLVIASKLIQIKSEALLPRPPAHDQDEEDLGETLAQQLILYREFKKSAAWLNDRNNKGLHSYLHIAKTHPVNVQVDLTGIKLEDLIQALERLVSEIAEPETGNSISIPKLTLRKKVEEIIETLQKESETSFRSLLADNKSRLNTIVVFLAILELVKQNMVVFQQEQNFADIKIAANENILELVNQGINIED